MIVDTDMGSDDWLALSYLLKAPTVDVRAISIVTTGESDCKPGLTMAAALLKITHHSSTPIACGPNKPLQGHKQFPNWFRSLINHHFNLTLPINKKINIQKSAVQLMYRTLLHSQKKITFLAIGPLTNMALLFQKHPDIKKKIQRMYILGGAIHVPGNIKSLDPKNINNVAEWNLYIDAYAAKQVLLSGVPLTFVPLDACNQVRLDMNFYHRITAQAKTPAAHFVQQILEKNLKFIKTNEFYFWDPLAAAISIDHDFYTTRTQKLSINLTPGKHYANIHASQQGTHVNWVEHVDGAKFKQLYIKQLNS